MRLGGLTKNGLIVGSLAAIIISLGTIPSPAGALSLGQLDINLPLGDVSKPVTDIVSPVTEALPLPVEIDSTPNKVSASLTLPSLSGQPNPDPEFNATATLPLVQSVTEPLSSVTNPVLQPVTNTVTPVTKSVAKILQPLTQSTTPQANSPQSQLRRIAQPLSQMPIADNNTPLIVQASKSGNELRVIGASVSRNSSSALSESAAESTTEHSSPSRFFSSSLSNVMNGFASSFIGKDINPLPIVISAFLLILTILAVGTIVYTLHYGGKLVIGPYNLSKIAEAHDVTEMASLVIVTLCFGFVAIFLSLTIL